MKLTKYTFRTPLFGSIEAEELLSDTHERIELSPEQMCRMYDQGPELLRFLTDNSEDLAFAVPAELKDFVLRAEFGDCAMIGGKMWLRTYIWTEEDVDETVICRLMDWITGQMSDGWGEGLEQRDWKGESVRKPIMYFDDSSCEFEEDYEDCWVYYYVHPWNRDDFEIYLEDVAEVEEETKFTLIASVDVPMHQRQVIKVREGFDLKMFLRYHGQEDILEDLRNCCPLPHCDVYLVRDRSRERGEQFLPKWIMQAGDFSTLYNTEDNMEVKSTQMPLSKAILELLK